MVDFTRVVDIHIQSMKYFSGLKVVHRPTQLQQTSKRVKRVRISRATNRVLCVVSCEIHENGIVFEILCTKDKYERTQYWSQSDAGIIVAATAASSSSSDRMRRRRRRRQPENGRKLTRKWDFPKISVHKVDVRFGFIWFRFTNIKSKFIRRENYTIY